MASRAPVRRSRKRAVLAGVANPDEVAAWAEDLSEAYLMCRDLGHPWKPYRAWPEGGGYTRVLKCSRCKTERTQALSAYGVPVSGHYDYPDGYVAPKGTGRMDTEGRGAMRLVSVQRMVEKSAPQKQSA